MTSNLTIVGNLTKDPELRFTPTGQATASFAVAVNRAAAPPASQASANGPDGRGSPTICVG